MSVASASSSTPFFLLLLLLLLLLIALHVLRQLLSNIGFYLNDEGRTLTDAFTINEIELRQLSCPSSAPLATHTHTPARHSPCRFASRNAAPPIHLASSPAAKNFFTLCPFGCIKMIKKQFSFTFLALWGLGTPTRGRGSLGTCQPPAACQLNYLFIS